MAHKSWRGDAETRPSMVAESDRNFLAFDEVMTFVPLARLVRGVADVQLIGRAARALV